jgi:hypothetical protein
MKTLEEITQILANVRAMQLEKVEIDGVTYYTKQTTIEAKSQPIPEEIKPEDIMAPMSVFDEPDEDEILYWSTPYYDEIMAKKQAMKEAKESGTNEIPNT